MFKNLFKKKPVILPPSEYNFVDIDVSDLDKYPEGLSNIMDRKIDGFIVRNVLTEEEVQGIIQTFDKIPNDEKMVIEGKMISFPKVFASIRDFNEDWKEKMKAQQREWEKITAGIKQEFSVDYIEKVRQILLKVGGGAEVHPAKGIDQEGIYIPTSVRRMYKEQNAVTLHCGRMFHGLLPEFYRHLKDIADIENQMSYFIMLQPSETGGELTLYDVEWSEADKKTGEYELERKDGSKIDLSDRTKVRQQPIKPGRGDMILFAGSSIWHRVEVGSTDRMTLGGFMAKSRKENEFYFWS